MIEALAPAPLIAAAPAAAPIDWRGAPLGVAERPAYAQPAGDPREPRPAGARPWEARWIHRGGFDEGWSEWQAWQAAFGGDSLGSDPDWCRGIETVYPGSLRWVRLRSGPDALLVPWLLRRREMDCRLGEWAWLRFHPRLLQPAGEMLATPEDPDLYAALFRALQEEEGEVDTPHLTGVAPYGRSAPWLRSAAAGARSAPGASELPRWDVLHLTVPTASPLWAWLQAGHAQALGLRVYQPHPPSPHFLLDFPDSFAAYTAKFTPKTRKNRERELRHLEQQGQLELRCYQAEHEVDDFLAHAGAVSQASYQHKLLKTGMRETARLRPRLLVAARMGWLRSYVLRCGGEPCAYMLGYQYRGRYHYTTIGYHPRWAALSAGTVMHWLALQHMFAHNPPRRFDFGACGPQKRYFSNTQFEEASLYLFRPGAYPFLVRTCHHASLRASRQAVSFLKRHRLHAAAQRCIRKLTRC